MKLMVNSTISSLWFNAVLEAESRVHINLEQAIEAYLVHMLIRHTPDTCFITSSLALDLLKGLRLPPMQRKQAMQDLGDACLLYAGLFPGSAQKRQVNIAYFAKLGQMAYSSVGTLEQIYQQLAEGFVPLMDVLQGMRQYKEDCPDLLPMQAFELWAETGSKRALMMLNLYSSAYPIKSDNQLPE